MSGESPSAYVVRRSAASCSPWKGRAPLLGHLDVELTERCNNDCIHCYVNRAENDEAARQRELTTAELLAVFGEAASLGALTVAMTGGEPLLREDFEELYLGARRLGMGVRLQTNARCVTPGLAGLLARVPPRARVEVSVYGMTSESYEAVSRAPGSYAQFRRGVELLAEHRVPLAVKGVFLGQNRQEKQVFETWARTLPGMDEGPRYGQSLDLRARRDHPAKDRMIRGLRLSAAQSVGQLHAREEGRRETCAVCRRFMGARGDRLFSCEAGRRVCLDAYGMLQPCLLVRHPETVYNLKKGSLAHALREFFPRLRLARSGNPAYLARCARCFLYGLCDQCPGKSWTEHGTLDTPVEHLCEVAHARARGVGLLGAEERAWQVPDGADRVRRMGLDPEPRQATLRPAAEMEAHATGSVPQPSRNRIGDHA